MTEIKPGTLPHLAGYIEQLGTPETLEQAIAERNDWIESAAQFNRNEDYYRGLVERIGQAIGPQAYIADDGSKSQDVLCAKVPELVTSLIAGLREAREALAESREALHFHYVEWDGEPEDAVPLQLARSQCDAALAKLDTLLSQEVQP